MKRILRWFYNTWIDPKTPNFISRIFARIEGEKHDALLMRQREGYKERYVFFDAPGGGNICISKDAHGHCGGTVGFSFGVSWGRYGFTGSVLGRNEAMRLAKHIMAVCAEIKETEQEERERFDAKIKRIAN